MRLLTPEQQARQRPEDRIGTSVEQGLPRDSSGSNFSDIDISPLYKLDEITDWRMAIAVGCVRRSRYGEWEPFRKSDGCEKVINCQFGQAWAHDGVHILIRGVDMKWFSRSAQVVEFIIHRPYGGKPNRVKASEYLKPKPINKTASLLEEYSNL